jgi:hypothetical protein
VREVLALPFSEVKEESLRLISDGKVFRVVTGQKSDNPSLDQLGPVLREFFSKFESVEEIDGYFSVGRRQVGDSLFRPGYIRIGCDFSCTELVVRPYEDRVFIVNDTERPLDAGLPTIYHNIYLLRLDRGRMGELGHAAMPPVKPTALHSGPQDN